MSREQKLLERLRDFNRDQGWDFGELCGLLQRLGFEMRITGSHHFFKRADLRDIINLQPQNGRVSAGVQKEISARVQKETSFTGSNFQGFPASG